jgi:hypothetical protein
MKMHSCWLLCVALLFSAEMSTGAQAQIWTDRQAFDSISSSSEPIQTLTANENPVMPVVEPDTSAKVAQGSQGPELGEPDEEATGPFVDDFCDCDTRQPCCWTLWAGAIFLHRSHATVNAFSTTDQTALLEPLRYSFNTPGGPDLNAIRHGENFDVDFRYFNVNQMNGSRVIHPVEELLVGGGSGVVNDRVDTSYVTNLQSVEFNLRRNVTPNVTLLAGLRYLSLRENLSAQFATDPSAPDSLGVQVKGINRLFGVQIGAAATLWDFGFFQVQTAIKAGIYGNRATNGLLMTGLDPLDLSTGSSASHAAFVGDWNFTGVYQLTDHWSVRGGYQMLWLSGVALASQQLAGVTDGVPNVAIHTSGNVFYNGALLSLQASW